MLVCLQNQHDLRELAGGLRTTPFWKAIGADSCKGVIQVMDNKCTPPTRVWCVLEVLAPVCVIRKLQQTELIVTTFANPFFM